MKNPIAQTHPKSTLAIRVAVIMAALTILRLIFAGIAELLPEEAYYWTYWKHPAWSYFDHPPMVAWVIGLGTSLFGDNEFGVRFGTITLSAASCALLFLVGRFWFGEKPALWAALLYAALPVFAGAGFIVTPDQPLLFFWLLALWAFSNAVRFGKWRDWLLGGIAFGAALLSKYYALLLGPSLLLFLALSREHRRWLLRPQPWIAFALALGVFSPVIMWNAQHQWASFLFQSTRTATSHPQTLRHFAAFWGVQLGIVTPLVFALFIFTVWKGAKRILREQDDRWIFALSFSLPLFFLFAAASLKTEVHVNWTAPAFLSLLPAVDVVFEEQLKSPSRSSVRWTQVGAWLTFILCAAVIIAGFLSLAWGVPRIYEQAGGWRQVAAAVKSEQALLSHKTGKDPFVLDTGKYDFAAEIGFYSHQPEEQINNYALGKSGLGFRYWMTLEKFNGRPAVALMEKPDRSILRQLRDHFELVDAVQSLSFTGPGKHQRTVYLVSCQNYHSEVKNDDAK